MFFSFNMLFFFLVYLYFESKLIVLLIFEGFTLFFISFYFTYFYMVPSTSLIFVLMMVLDSVFALTLLVCSSRSSLFLLGSFSNF